MNISNENLHNIIDSLITRIDLISESDNDSIDTIKSTLFDVYQSFLKYKKENYFLDTHDKLLIEELDTMFSHYDYL